MSGHWSALVRTGPGPVVVEWSALYKRTTGPLLADQLRTGAPPDHSNAPRSTRSRDTTAGVHRRCCACTALRAAPADAQLCTAHGTAARAALAHIARTTPGRWLIGNGEFTCARQGLSAAGDIADIEWHTAHRIRRALAAAGRPVDHIDVYLDVVAPLLPARQRRALARLAPERTAP